MGAAATGDDAERLAVFLEKAGLSLPGAEPAARALPAPAPLRLRLPEEAAVSPTPSLPLPHPAGTPDSSSRARAYVSSRLGAAAAGDDLERLAAFLEKAGLSLPAEDEDGAAPTFLPAPAAEPDGGCVPVAVSCSIA